MDKEEKRLLELSVFENELYGRGYSRIAGVDEAGRGPLAGPVVAAAVILPSKCQIRGLNDSKKLSSQKREKLFIEIRENAEGYGVGIVSCSEIDRINIHYASLKAMRLAVLNLHTRPDYLLIDGCFLLKELAVDQQAVKKGDERSVSVAAASIIAKVTRDHLMAYLDQLFPVYNFKKHNGYPTKEHLEAINQHGGCPVHRYSFTPFKV